MIDERLILNMSAEDPRVTHTGQFWNYLDCGLVALMLDASFEARTQWNCFCWGSSSFKRAKCLRSKQNLANENLELQLPVCLPCKTFRHLFIRLSDYCRAPTSLVLHLQHVRGNISGRWINSWTTSRRPRRMTLLQYTHTHVRTNLENQVRLNRVTQYSLAIKKIKTTKWLL